MLFFAKRNNIMQKINQIYYNNLVLAPGFSESITFYLAFKSFVIKTELHFGPNGTLMARFVWSTRMKWNYESLRSQKNILSIDLQYSEFI